MLEFPHSQPVLLYIVAVHELAGGSTVYERGPRLDFSGISGLYFHLDDQGLGARGGCCYISFWKPLFPLVEAEQTECRSCF